MSIMTVLLSRREQGLCQESSHYTLVAATLRIAPSSQASMVQVDLNSALALTVASPWRSGRSARIPPDGLTATLPAGTTLAFEPQAAPAAVVKITGLVEFRDGAYLLTDGTTKVTVQLEGANLATYVGTTVQVISAPPFLTQTQPAELPNSFVSSPSSRLPPAALLPRVPGERRVVVRPDSRVWRSARLSAESP